eukprot:scaffold67621_cov69-Phaeocystis_antarctica.AAC.1
MPPVSQDAKPRLQMTHGTALAAPRVAASLCSCELAHRARALAAELPLPSLSRGSGLVIMNMQTCDSK